MFKTGINKLAARMEAFTRFVSHTSRPTDPQTQAANSGKASWWSGYIIFSVNSCKKSNSTTVIKKGSKRCEKQLNQWLHLATAEQNWSEIQENKSLREMEGIKDGLCLVGWGWRLVKQPQRNWWTPQRELLLRWAAMNTSGRSPFSLSA